MHLVNSFNAGVTNDFITPTDSAASGDPVISAGPGCQYAHQDGHYAVICPDPGDELYWETGNPAAWHPSYYLRFDMYIEAAQPSWGVQRYATFFIGDGINFAPADIWVHFLWVQDDGRLWVEDANSTRLIDLGIQFRFGEWNTITFSQDLGTGETRLTIQHPDGTGVNSGPVIYPAMTAGLNSLTLGRPGGMGSGGTTLYIDNLRGYNTGTVPNARNPHTGSDPETPGPHPTDPWTNDPDPTNTDPDDPTWNPPVTPTPDPPTATGIAPTHGPDTGGTVVTITGADLTAVHDVLFGFVPGTSIVEHGGATLTVTTPAHMAGPFTVQIDTDGGADSTLTYTYDDTSGPVTPPTPPVTPHDPEDPIPGPYPDDPWTPPTPPAVDPVITPPSVVDGPTYNDPELLYSTIAFTQRGIELGVNQGVVPCGTVVAQDTTNRRWYPYDNSGINGRNVARGVLRWSVDTDRGPQLAPMVIQGLLRLDAIHGLDAAALTDLGGTINAVRGFLRI